MKKFTLFFIALAFISSGFSQDFGGAYPNCTEPTGFTFGQGARITPYTNPMKNCNNGKNDCGIITPGVGGNNPANVIFPATVVQATTTGFTRCFSVFVFDANLNCTSNKDFSCDTYVTAYLVLEDYNSTSAPSSTDYYGKSDKKLVSAFGTENCIFVAFTNAPDPTKKYRVFLDFTNDGTCNQQNTKYVIDIFSPGAPTQLSLKSFTANKKDNSTQLTWQTSSEVNSKYVDVQFSTNGNQWQSIGRLNAAGNSSVRRDYSFVHQSPVNGANYYRLAAVDKEGRITYSNIVVINFTITGITVNSVNPNPFHDKIKIELSSEKSEKVFFQLSDNFGRVLKSSNSVLQKGTNHAWMNDLGSLPQSIYTLQVKTPYTTYRVKIKK